MVRSLLDGLKLIDVIIVIMEGSILTAPFGSRKARSRCSDPKDPLEMSAVRFKLNEASGTPVCFDRYILLIVKLMFFADFPGIAAIALEERTRRSGMKSSGVKHTAMLSKDLAIFLDYTSHLSSPLSELFSSPCPIIIYTALLVAAFTAVLPSKYLNELHHHPSPSTSDDGATVKEVCVGLCFAPMHATTIPTSLITPTLLHV